MAADFLPDLKEAVLESKKESRGPPAEEKGHASIDLNADVKGSEYLTYHFSGKVNVDYSKIYVSDQELAIISYAVKTGWGTLNKARTLGRSLHF
jgi:hypothetical protein